MNSLIAWWPADGHANDLAGNSHGTLYNGTTFQPRGAGQAFSFDGVNDLCRVPNSPVLQPASISVEAWIKGTSPGSFRYVLNKFQNGANSSYAIYTGPDGGLYFYVTVGNNNVVLSPNAGAGVWNNAFHHVVGTCDGTRVRLYVDGIQIGSGTAASGPIQYSNDPANELAIGNYTLATANQIYGLRAAVDDVRLYNRALSGAEIQALHEAGSAELCLAPAILSQPISQVASPGTGLSFSVATSGTQPLTYQWQLNGVNIADATNATLVIPYPNSTHAGIYSIVVSNAYGVTTSQAATLTLLSIQTYAGLTISGPIGASYRIDARSTVSPTNVWQTLTNFALPSSPFLFIDYDSPNHPTRFYRAVPLP